jgi:hypothetical protein
MIGIGSELLPPHLPASSRGFSWWYADIVGTPGNAVVLLWARRLPIVPAAGDDAPLAVALAVYRDGQEHFYALQTSAEELARSAPGELRIGNSCFRVSERQGGVSLRADLDLVLPGSGRVRGVVELSGPRVKLDGSSRSELDWLPVAAAASGQASLEWEGGAFTLSGRAYFDGNAARAPLPELGIDDWRWGRIAMPEREVVYFQLSAAGNGGPPTVLSIDRDGHARFAERARASFSDAVPGWFGLRRCRRASLEVDGEELQIDFDHQVEDGFFYQRYLAFARSSTGEVGYGVAERVVPGRLDASWHRPLVDMRVDRRGVAPSMWFPLFSGAKSGRVSRLLASWRGAVRPVTT